MINNFFVSGLKKMNIKEEVVDPLHFGENENDENYDQKLEDPLSLPFKNEIIKNEIESDDIDETSVQVPSLSENYKHENTCQICNKSFREL